MENIVTEVVPDELRQERNMHMGDDVPSGSMDASELVESLLSNEHIPKDIQKQWWVLFGKSTKLSFLNQEDIDHLLLEFELLKLTTLESIPKNAYDEKLEHQLIMARMEFELNLRRSKGGRLNERELLGSSTQATFSERSMGHASESPGFLDKIARVLGGH